MKGGLFLSPLLHKNPYAVFGRAAVSILKKISQVFVIDCNVFILCRLVRVGMAVATPKAW
jgi:hypothetical protein